MINAQGFQPIHGVGTSCTIMSWAYKQVYVMFESRGLFKCNHTSVRQYDTSDDVTILMFDPKSPSQE